MSETPIWEIPEYLDEFIAEDPEAGKDLVVTFIEDTAQQILALQNALTAPDLKLAGRLLHSLKGSSSQMGALELSGVCQAAESTLEAGDVAAVLARLDDLQASRASAVALMRDRLHQAGAALPQ